MNFSWRWPMVIVIVLIALVVIQILRVNAPKEATLSEPPRVYTAAGRLMDGEITIAAREFYSNRIDLNRRSKLSGSFLTPNVKSKVAVLVLSEKDFESWKIGEDSRSLAQTGYVPGGKVNVALEPGVFYLVIDNKSDKDQVVYADFTLER